MTEPLIRLVDLGRIHAPIRADLDAAMKGHVIGEGVLVGTFQH